MSAVWITGVGTCTPLGDTFDNFAENLLAGRSCIRRVESFPVEDHPSQIAGQVRRVPCPEGNATDFYRLPRVEQLARWCCVAALRDAGYWDKRNSLRIGLVLGLGSEWLLFWEADGLARPTDDWQPPTLDDSLIARTSRTLGLT